MRNAEAHREQMRQAYAANPELYKARSRAYYVAHREEINARRRADHVRQAAAQRAYMAKNRDKVREWKRADYQRHREDYKRRARTVGLDGDEVRVVSLPTELQAVADAIRDSRREIRMRSTP